MRTEQLPVALTDEELIHRGHALAVLEEEIALLEQEKKDVAADYKAKLDLKKGEALRLSAVIQRKAESREVEVIERLDYNERRVETVRVDTGEVVNSRPMNVDDAQEVMFNEDRHEGKIARLGM